MTEKHPLDGTYIVSTTISDQAQQHKSDGETIINNGQTCRYDDVNCKWTSTFAIINEAEVKMTSIADASDANADFFLIGEGGVPTRSPVTFTSILKLARKGEKVQISGQVDHGGDLVFITMRKKI